MSPPRAALLTSRRDPSGGSDELQLVAALEAHGVEASWVCWDAPLFDSERFDGIVVRSVWDYTDRCEAFLQRIDALAARGARIANAPPLLRWNAEKSYLLALAERGVDIVPTRIGDGAQLGELAREALDRGWADIVMKPAVAAGGLRTWRGPTSAVLGDGVSASRMACDRVADPRMALAPRAGERWLVQPFVESVLSEGELSLVWLGGERSHAVRKRPRAGEFRVQERWGGHTEPFTADDATWREGARMIAASLDAAACDASARPLEPPLYARVDGVVVDGRFVLGEIELIEPVLFLSSASGSLDRFAAAITRWIESAPGGAAEARA